ncbi:MAG: hypothetical protein LBJ97_00100, partial [Mycoplasmataceae bacterium]|nr:hypothetical protein [Mycoplasmataceae bacterium]
MRVFKTILLSTIITTVTLGTALPLAIIYTKKNATFLIKFQDDRSNLKGRGDKIDLNVYSNGRLYDNVYYKNDEVTKEYIKIEGNSIYCIKNPTQALNDIYISAYDKKTNKFLVKTTIGIDVDIIKWHSYSSSMSVGDEQKLIAESTTNGKIGYKVVGTLPSEVTFNAVTGEIKYVTATKTNTTVTIEASSNNGCTSSVKIVILSPSASQDNISWGTYKSSMSVGDKQTITATSSNSGKITYKTIGTVPPEVTFDATKGEIDYKTAVATNTFITIQSDSDKGGTAQIEI